MSRNRDALDKQENDPSPAITELDREIDVIAQFYENFYSILDMEPEKRRLLNLFLPTRNALARARGLEERSLPEGFDDFASLDIDIERIASERYDMGTPPVEGGPPEFTDLTYREAFHRIFNSVHRRLPVESIIEVLESKGRDINSKNKKAAISSKLSKYDDFDYEIVDGEYLWGPKTWTLETEESIAEEIHELGKEHGAIEDTKHEIDEVAESVPIAYEDEEVPF